MEGSSLHCLCCCAVLSARVLQSAGVSDSLQGMEQEEGEDGDKEEGGRTEAPNGGEAVGLQQDANDLSGVAVAASAPSAAASAASTLPPAAAADAVADVRRGTTDPQERDYTGTQYIPIYVMLPVSGRVSK